jgi:hypothetical protein
MTANGNGDSIDTAEEYRRLLRGEITPKEYVAVVKKSVNARLGIEPSRFGRAGRRSAVAGH